MTKKQDLENKEKQELLARIAELEAKQRAIEERNRRPAINHLEEMKQLRARGRDDSSTIKYKDIHDHRNIRLYHTTGFHVGRAIGPIHPANAEETFQRFHEKGIILSIQRPTQEYIDWYKSTDEYKALAEKEKARRDGKISMSKENSIEKLTKAIGDVVNRIKSPQEVGVGR